DGNIQISLGEERVAHAFEVEDRHEHEDEAREPDEGLTAEVPKTCGNKHDGDEGDGGREDAVVEFQRDQVKGTERVRDERVTDVVAEDPDAERQPIEPRRLNLQMRSSEKAEGVDAQNYVDGKDKEIGGHGFNGFDGFEDKD